MLQIISLGAGVQSSVMALMAAQGELTPMPDCAIFADTQFEPQGVYDHLDWLEKQLPFPVHRVTAGNLRNDTIAGRNIKGHEFSAIPFFTKSGMGRRQCTEDYKIVPVRRKISTIVGTKKKPGSVRQWIGISIDEAARMKPSRVKYIDNVFPLVEKGMSRQNCLLWFEKKYPNRQLAKSACIACPYHNDAQWRDMKIHDSNSFEKAVAFDAAIRNSGTSTEQYVHRSCKPLDEVDLRNLEDMGQLNFFENECEGMCGV